MLVVIKHDCLLSADKCEELSLAYSKQIERGALVIGNGCSVEIVAGLPQGTIIAQELTTKRNLLRGRGLKHI